MENQSIKEKLGRQTDTLADIELSDIREYKIYDQKKDLVYWINL